MADLMDAMLSDEGKPDGGTPTPEPAPKEAPAEGGPKPEGTPPPQPTPSSPQPDTGQPQGAAKPEPGFVPLAAVLDERDKRQKIEREFEALKRQHAQKPNAPPSPYDDPDAYARYVEGRMAEQERHMRFNFSEERAEEKHGKPLLDEAKAWAENLVQSEAMAGETRFVDTLFKQPKPFEWLITQFKRDKLLKDVGDDPDAYVRRRYAELTAPSGSSPQPTPQAKPFTAPKTIAGVASAAGGGARAVPVGPGQPFDAVFTE